MLSRDPIALALVLRTAVFYFGAYSAWLFAFERWVEPVVRGGVSSACRQTVVWVPVVRGLRTWAPLEPSRPGLESALALLSALIVLASGILPAVALAWIASRFANDPRISASSYLICVPAAALFTFHVLGREPREP
jgi:hypothetical protein